MYDIKKIEEYVKFPAHIREKDGEELAKIFVQKPLEKSNNRMYCYDYNGYRYFLFEELMWEENDSFLELNKLIGKNFFLNREKL